MGQRCEPGLSPFLRFVNLRGRSYLVIDAEPSMYEFTSRFDYSGIAKRKPLKWPKGAHVAVWIVPNVEYYPMNKPGPALTGVPRPEPDVLNYAWRDYGLRVGIWRMMEIMDRYKVRGTVALNSEVCKLCPDIIAEGNKLGWEWMGHGPDNSTFFDKQDEATERAMIRQTVQDIGRYTGRKPRGWLSPGLTETFNTPDLLVEEGIEYNANWANDDQPYPMKTRTGNLLSVPYAVEAGDFPGFISNKQSAEEYYKLMVDQFDVLYDEGATSGRVVAFGLHPFLIGQPFRAKYFDLALKHFASHDKVWFATGGEIADWYRSNYMDAA
jgi:peptidoglycan/xylan/chitin deacetylase (PgdA/CDA1 family)